MKILFLVLLGLSTSSLSFATCVMRTNTCSSSAPLTNTYKIVTTNCAIPGKTVKTVDYTISNPLFAAQVIRQSAIFNMEVTTLSPTSIHVDILDQRENVSPNLSTSADLNDYTCLNTAT